MAVNVLIRLWVFSLEGYRADLSCFWGVLGKDTSAERQINTALGFRAKNVTQEMVSKLLDWALSYRVPIIAI